MEYKKGDKVKLVKFPKESNEYGADKTGYFNSGYVFEILADTKQTLLYVKTPPGYPNGVCHLNADEVAIHKPKLFVVRRNNG